VTTDCHRLPLIATDDLWVSDLDDLLTVSECIPHQVGQDAPVHERVAVFVAGHIYVHEHGRPACLPVTHYRDGYETHQFWRIFPDSMQVLTMAPFPHRYETHQFWRIFPDPPQLELAPVTNNYDKYANAYIDVSTQSCVTPSNAWERKIPKSLYSVR
jgi:hypothetical protein